MTEGWQSACHSPALDKHQTAFMCTLKRAAKCPQTLERKPPSQKADIKVNKLRCRENKKYAEIKENFNHHEPKIGCRVKEVKKNIRN